MTYSSNINKLLARGAEAFATKKYEVAADVYGEACQSYSEEKNGEEDPELLYLYGKALFEVGVSNNGLFGGTAAEETSNESKEDEEKPIAPNNELFQFNDEVTDQKQAYENDEEEAESEKEGENGGEEGEQKEEQSDFEIAWEILDLSRSLFQLQLDALDDKNTTPIDDPASSTDKAYQLKLKLSNLHDLLGEISLETENFKQSTEDFLSTLELRSQIFKFNSNLISEIHYKISLSLEFNHELEGSKEKAIEHLQKAIESIERREEKDNDLIKELQARLLDLKKDPNQLLDEQKKEILKGILGESTGSASSESNEKKVVTEAKVNDLTSMVKKRKPKKNDSNNNSKKPKN